MAAQQFTCIHCGERFVLTPEDEQLREQGYITPETDTCYECSDMLNSAAYEQQFMEQYSDADPGL